MIRIRKMGADRQVHSSGSGKTAVTRATVAQAVAEMLATTAGAATTARALRYANPPMIGVSELSL